MLDALPFADPTQASGRLVHVEGDLGMDAAEFAALVPRGCEVLFHVCHVAEAQTHVARGISAPGFQPEGAEEHARVNLVAMDNVIHAARKAGVRRIVYCSSWSSYGRQPAGKDVTEATESRAYDVVNASLCGCLGPASTPVPYFVCKLLCEQRLVEATKGGGGGESGEGGECGDGGGALEAVIIQPCSVFGCVCVGVVVWVVWWCGDWDGD